MSNISFSSESLEFWYVLGRGYLYDQLPIKNFGHRISNKLPWLDSISHGLSQCTVGGIRCILCDSMGRKLLEACTWFSLDIATYGFSLCWFWFVLFCCNNYSHEHNDIPSPVSSPSESLNPREVSGTSDQIQKHPKEALYEDCNLLPTLLSLTLWECSAERQFNLL